MNPQTESIRFDTVDAELPLEYERTQFRLPALGMTMDKYGRAHDATTGKFMTGKALSEANIRTIDLWQDNIAEHAPGNQQSRVGEEAPVIAEPIRRIIPPMPPVTEIEPASLRQRVTQAFRRTTARARSEIYLLPQTALQLAGRGLAKAAGKYEKVPGRRVLTPVLGAIAFVGYASSAYASAKYGAGGGGSTLKHDLLTGLTQHKSSVSPHAHHEAISALSYDPNSSTSHHEAVSQLHYDPSAPAANHDAVNQLNTPAQHKAVSGLHYDPESNQGHVPHEHHGGDPNQFDPNVFVERGHGYTNELQDLAGQQGISLSGDESWQAYLHLNAQFNGHFFTNDPSYLRDAGDWGISRPGSAHWDPQVIMEFNRWLELTKKK